MSAAPHIANGYQCSCPCGAELHVGAMADGSPGAAHALPLCDKFAELDLTAFLIWLHDARRSSPTPAVIQKREHASTLGRLAS